MVTLGLFATSDTQGHIIPTDEPQQEPEPLAPRFRRRHGRCSWKPTTCSTSLRPSLSASSPSAESRPASSTTFLRANPRS